MFLFWEHPREWNGWVGWSVCAERFMELPGCFLKYMDCCTFLAAIYHTAGSSHSPLIRELWKLPLVPLGGWWAHACKFQSGFAA